MTRLKFERVRRGLSQSALAHLAGVPQPAVSLAESGRLAPAPEELSALARVLGLPASALLLQVEIVDSAMKEGGGA